jgi:outer membrane autotransporter protein
MNTGSSIRGRLALSGPLESCRAARDRLICTARNYRSRTITLTNSIFALVRAWRRRLSRPRRSGVLLRLAVVVLGAVAANGQDATWLPNPGSGDWNTATNWSPAIVPTGTATFGTSNTTAITFSDNTSIANLQFNSGAPAYSFTISGFELTIFGSGILSSSSNLPTTLSVVASGILNFLGPSKAVNAIITNSGQGITITSFSGTSSADNAFITTNSGGLLSFSGSSTAGKAFVITNSGAATQFGESSTGGQAQFMTNAGGAFDISLLSPSTPGMTAGSIAGAGTYFLSSKALTVGLNNLSTTVDGTIRDGGVLGGTGGSLIKVGAGTLTLTGANTYSGGTSINGGVVAVNNVGNLGTGGLSFNGGALETPMEGSGITWTKGITLNAGGGRFLADAGTASSLTGVISGVGALTKDGAGELTLTGTNTYSGGTTIENGTLMVGSPQALGAGNVTVKGGALTTDPGAITVASNYAQTGGTLLLHVTGANPGQYDSLNVGGHATLGGTLQLVALNGFKLGTTQQLTLVTAQGGIQGQFSTFINPFARNGPLQPGLVYGPNSVILEFLKTSFVPFALTRSQRRVAANLDEVVAEQSPAPIRPESSPRDKATAALIDFLFREPATNLPEDFDRIVGTDLSSLYEMSFSGANIQRFNLTERMAEIRQGATGFSSSLSANRQQLPLGKGTVEEKSVVQPSPENRWGVFVSGNGDFVSVEGDENGHGYDFTTAGVTLGVDYRITKTLAIGLMGGYARTWADLARDGRVTVNTGKGGLYATWWDRGFYINGFVGGGYDSYDTRRGALQGFANGSTDGTEFDTFADVGYDAKIGNWSLGPYVTLAYTSTNLDGYSEHGSLAPLHFVSQHEQSLRTDLGFRAEYRIKAWGVELRPSVRAAWEHEYLYSALPIHAGLASGAGDIFTVEGPNEGHDSAIVGAGLNVQLTKSVLLYLDYDGQVGRDRYDSHAVTGGLRWSF